MEVVSGQLGRVAGAAPGAGNRRQSWPERQGLLLELRDAEEGAAAGAKRRRCPVIPPTPRRWPSRSCSAG